MTNLRCMSFLGKDSPEILVAGIQNTMYKIDVERGQVIQEVQYFHSERSNATGLRTLRFLQSTTIQS